MDRRTIIFLSILVFFMGLYYFVTAPRLNEGFVVGDRTQCPNKLVKKGEKYYLYNTRLLEVPGVNPIVFDHLEDYTEYIEWQRHHGQRCPVVYLEEGFDTQGEVTYLPRPGIDGTTLLLDAGRDDPPYNQDGYPAFDPDNQYIGEETPLDEMSKPPLIHANPMPEY